jgi:DNA polymerase alpha-associated DNA helicase A
LYPTHTDITHDQVSDTKITIAIDISDNSDDAADLPERCRVVKLANNVTYDRFLFPFTPVRYMTKAIARMDKAIDTLERRVLGKVCWSF